MIIITLLKTLFFFVSTCLLIYSILFILGLLIPINRKYHPIKNGVEFYIATNGLHTEFILPAIHSSYDWTETLHPASYHMESAQTFYFGIGWGDKAIYLDLEDWNQLTFAKGFRCLFIPSSSIMHIKSYEEVPFEEYQIEKISISSSQYTQLCDFILASFALDEQQKVQLIENSGYTNKDNFYHAIGKYHAFQTCNFWVNKGLKKVGVRTTLWTPIDKGLFYQLKKVKPTV